MNKYIENRPWGNFVRFTHNEPSTVKIITVEPNQGLSLQTHHKRSEFWKVLSGNPIITIGDKEVTAQPGDEFFVKEETPHCIATGETKAEILEIAFGTFDEADIVRLNDRYGRA